MANKIVKDNKIVLKKEEDFSIRELPKIFIRPQNIGDVMFMVGEVFAWAVLFVFVAGLSFYFKDGYSAIASNKYLFFITSAKYTAIVGGVLFLLRLCMWGFTLKEIQAYKKLMWMDIFAVAFGVFSVLSNLFSAFRGDVVGTGSNKIAAWYHQGPLYGLSGWYMGVVTYIVFVMLYFIISRCLVYNKSVYIIPVVTVTIISLWGVLNRYNIAPIDMKYNYAKEQSVFLASIGNINWLSGFSSVLVPLIWGLYMGAHKLWERIVYIICMVITFDMIILNGSDSGYFALAVTMMVLFGYTVTSRDKFRRFLEIAFCFFAVCVCVSVQDMVLRSRASSAGHLESFIGIPAAIAALIVAGIYVFTVLKKEWEEKRAKLIRNIYIIAVCVSVVLVVILIVVNTMTDKAIIQNSLFFFDDEWGSSRGITWKLGIQTFLHMDFWHKLVGSGPDTFYYEMITFDDLAFKVNDFFGGARLTNAHNEIITLLVNIGLLGTAAFLGTMGAAIKASFKYAKERPELIGFGLAVIFYLANNMFSFEQITNIPLMFVVLGMEGAAIVVYNKAGARLTKKDIKNKMHKSKKSRK